MFLTWPVHRRGTVQVFDVASFDMIAMLRLPFVPGVVEWVFKVGGRRGAGQVKGWLL